MAQQASNSQREPSMDEILASIRRIIEESEPDHAGNDLSAIEQLAAGPGPAANDVVEASARSLNEESVLLDRETAERLDIGADILSDAFDPEAFSLDKEFESAFRQNEPTLNIAPAPAKVSSAESDRVRVSELSDAMAASTAERAKTIISEQTGRQVAASFGNLADAFAASRQRSLDEVAEEMMRPMLQEWMDNNLPTLVEKLVREEIERVARGA